MKSIEKEKQIGMAEQILKKNYYMYYFLKK